VAPDYNAELYYACQSCLNDYGDLAETTCSTSIVESWLSISEEILASLVLLLDCCGAELRFEAHARQLPIKRDFGLRQTTNSKRMSTLKILY
jgi:hypothetical protein